MRIKCIKVHAVVRILFAQPGSAVSGLYFSRGRKSPAFPRVGLAGAVSGRQLPAFLSVGRGFRAPVSARFFPISVSGEGRRAQIGEKFLELRGCTGVVFELK
jgi:hypothetical protein